MASLKDTLIQGSARVTDTLYANNLNLMSAQNNKYQSLISDGTTALVWKPALLMSHDAPTLASLSITNIFLSKFSGDYFGNEEYKILLKWLNSRIGKFKILEDKRFNNISIFSFKNLFNVTIKNSLYGKYSKITNLEIIVDSLEKKELDQSMSELVQRISDNMDLIKRDIMKHNRVDVIEVIIEQLISL